MNLHVCHFTVAHEVTDGRIFKKECKSLRKAGYKVSIVVPNVKDCEIDGIYVYGVKLDKSPLKRLLIGAGKIYKRALELNADIYHFHDVELFYYGLKLKCKGKKVIFDSHENWLGYIQNIKWIPSLGRKTMTSLLRFLYKRDLKKFDAVITVSPDIVESLQCYTSKVHLVTNYPKINVDLLPKLSFENYSQRVDQVCYAGTIYPSSNQETIIQSLDLLKDVRYLLIGRLDSKDYSTLKGWDKVQLVDFVPFEELAEYYQSSCAGLCVFDDIPNIGGRKGSLGVNKIFEYMMFGLPVILSDQEMWRDLVEKYRCGLCVKAGNIEDVASKIKYVIQNKEEAFEMGKRGQAAVISEFNWDTQEKTLLEIYKNL